MTTEPITARVLVTGGTGFLTSYVIREALARGHRVRAPYAPQTGKATCGAWPETTRSRSSRPT